MGEYRYVVVVLWLLCRDFDQGFNQSSLSSAEVNWYNQIKDTGTVPVYISRDLSHEIPSGFFKKLKKNFKNLPIYFQLYPNAFSKTQSILIKC